MRYSVCDVMGYLGVAFVRFPQRRQIVYDQSGSVNTMPSSFSGSSQIQHGSGLTDGEGQGLSLGKHALACGLDFGVAGNPGGSVGEHDAGQLVVEHAAGHLGPTDDGVLGHGKPRG